MDRKTDHRFSPLLALHPDDLESLLTTPTEALFGAVLRLNRYPRYHNSLNAVVIAGLVLEIQHREPPGHFPAR
ncbi:MAG: hypothetical protein JNL43_05135 [Flavobacteriales bacterium]|nr:hypothetical protein [Flavobacteriales bacterium]